MRFCSRPAGSSPWVRPGREAPDQPAPFPVRPKKRPARRGSWPVRLGTTVIPCRGRAAPQRVLRPEMVLRSEELRHRIPHVEDDPRTHDARHRRRQNEGIRDGDYRLTPDGPGDEPLPGKGDRFNYGVECCFLPQPGQVYKAPPVYFGANVQLSFGHVTFSTCSRLAGTSRRTRWAITVMPASLPS